MPKIWDIAALYKFAGGFTSGSILERHPTSLTFLDLNMFGKVLRNQTFSPRVEHHVCPSGSISGAWCFANPPNHFSNLVKGFWGPFLLFVRGPESSRSRLGWEFRVTSHIYIYIYIYAVKLLTGPRLAILIVTNWATLIVTNWATPFSHYKNRGFRWFFGCSVISLCFFLFPVIFSVI